jgi:hypothetical protein
MPSSSVGLPCSHYVRLAQIYMAEQQTIDCSAMSSLSVDLSVSVCNSKLSLSDIFIAEYKGNCLMFVIFCCFRIVKHFDVSHCIRHKAGTLGTSLSPVDLKLINFWFEFFNKVGIFMIGKDQIFRKCKKPDIEIFISYTL